MCGALLACLAGAAQAGGRFGDSTWVAPDAPDLDGATAAGVRVAPRDRERGWESALRAPFRVAFYPLHLVSNGLEGGIGMLGPRYLDRKPPRPHRSGLVLTPAINVSAVNDIGIGPAVAWVPGPPAGSQLRVSGTWSTIDHRRARAKWTFGERQPVGFAASASWTDSPDQRYYGIGNVSDVARVAHFRLVSTEAKAGVSFGGSPHRQLRIGGGYSSMRPERGARTAPALESVFTPATAPFEFQATHTLWYGVGGDLAALDDARDPSRGVHGRFDLRRAAGVRADDPGYDQWGVEGRAYLPVFAPRRVIALRAVYAGVAPGRGAPQDLPFYRLALSEDASRFAGYAAGRFRDRQLAHARIEYRWEVFHRASALALYDVGEVQPRAGLFRLDAVHASWGGGLRMGLSDIATVRAELASSVEGLHAVLVLGGDF